MYVPSVLPNYSPFYGRGAHTWWQHCHLELQEARRMDRDMLMGD